MKNQLKDKRVLKFRALFVLSILIFMLFSFSNGMASNNFSLNPCDTIFDDEVLMVVEKMPVFTGGEIALRRFIAENVKYPEKAKKNDVQGKVFVHFVVDTNGKIQNVKIARGVNALLDAEAVRVIKSLPNFEKPGYQRGKAVNVYYTVPINFQLN